MGEAKRRRQLDPTFGQLEQYTLEVSDRQGELCSIPYAVAKRRTQKETDMAAQSIAILVFSLLQEPIPPTYNMVQRALGTESADALLAIAPLRDFHAHLFTAQGEDIGTFSTDPLPGEELGKIWAEDVLERAIA